MLRLARHAQRQLPRLLPCSRLPACSLSDRADEPKQPIQDTSLCTRVFGSAIDIQLTPEQAAASNRYLRLTPFMGSQFVTGSVYTTSLYTGPLCMIYGGFAPAAADWTASQLPLLTISAVTFGSAGFLLGPAIDRIGPRASIGIASLCWGAGFGLTSLGCSMHSLPLVLASYGGFVGAAWAFGYLGPVGGQMAWFPDKRGTVTGLSMSMFALGGVASVETVLASLKHFAYLPELVGNITDPSISLVTEGGVRFLELQGKLQEVMIAGPSQCLLNPELMDGGVYLVGTGNSGIAETFGLVGAGLFGVQFLASRLARTPPEGFWPPGVPKPETQADGGTVVEIDAVQAVRTTQFWCFWGCMVGNATAGLGIISAAKILMSDCFSTALPHIATGAFCGSFVSALNVTSAGGRLGWGMGADVVGRRACLMGLGVSVPMLLALPTFAEMATTQPELGAFSLYGFSAAICVTSACYGGVFALIPPYLADIYGPKHTGAIWGRVLTGFSAAAVLGPLGLNYMRSTAELSAIQDLVTKCDPATFENTFGSPIQNLDELISAKTVTIQKLLEIIPPELSVVDPTAGLYTVPIYFWGGTVATAALCASLIRPLSQHTIDKLTKQ